MLDGDETLWAVNNDGRVEQERYQREQIEGE